MKSKQEFADAFADEFTGFLLSAFTQNEKPDMTERGRFMNLRLKQVRPLLEKMYDFIAEIKPEPVKSSAETLVEDLLKVYPTLNAEGKEKMKERLRAAFVPAVNGKEKQHGK